MHQMLKLTFGPYVAGSLRDIPRKYHLITRLWLHGFHRLLESLRRAALPPNIQVAGSSYTGVGIPDCVNAGRTAARDVVAALGVDG